MRDETITPRRIIAWTLVILIGLALAGWAAWGLKVLTSEVKGEGDAVIQRNSAENWTAAQARFEDLYAEIVASDLKITDAKARMDQSPTDLTVSNIYYGTQSYCRSVVADYNAEAGKFLSQDFRSTDLPDQISTIDPKTDCEA